MIKPVAETVANGESRKKYGEAHKASRLKNWLVGAHGPSLSNSNIAQVCDGR